MSVSCTMTVFNGKIAGRGPGGGRQKSKRLLADLHTQTSRPTASRNLSRSQAAYILQLNTIFRQLEPLQNQHSSEEA